MKNFDISFFAPAQFVPFSVYRKNYRPENKSLFPVIPSKMEGGGNNLNRSPTSIGYPLPILPYHECFAFLFLINVLLLREQYSMLLARSDALGKVRYCDHSNDRMYWATRSAWRGFGLVVFADRSAAHESRVVVLRYCAGIDQHSLFHSASRADKEITVLV